MFFTFQTKTNDWSSEKIGLAKKAIPVILTTLIST